MMVIAAVALVLDSFLPWYVERWTSMRYGTGQVTEHVNTASAWASSTAWSAGIMLTVTAVLGWLLWPRRLSRRVRDAGTAIVALAAAVTTVSTWLIAIATPDGDGGTYRFVSTLDGGPRLGSIVRDSLTSGTAGWGFYIGVLLMLTIAACALLLRRRDAHATPAMT
ncbi:hypothetical protein AB0F72_26140 [Actinoplanes sp. NPDC023936]|uniref:hypothetical protein n=1 Tax=Actinoplanes sp. NPDC023936 TaxID=3154910 RepID=UPI003408FFA7